MNFELIDDETLDSLPDDPGLAFVMFERVCRVAMLNAIEREDSSSVIESYRLDYMHDVVAAARFYEIPDIKNYKISSGHSLDWDAFEDFSRRVRFYTMHYRLSARAQRSQSSVELQGTHKDRIRTLIAHLKTAVDSSEMPDWRKDRLRKSIADFEKALDGKRLNFVAAMTFLAVIGAGLHGIGQGADGVGKLVREITVAIGQSKEIEDTNRPLLPEAAPKSPVYMIEQSEERSESPSRQDLDDEIPF